MTENTWANEGFFVPTSPVHGVAWVGDVLVFNSWKFWTGNDLWLPDPGAYAGAGTGNQNPDRGQPPQRRDQGRFHRRGATRKS